MNWQEVCEHPGLKDLPFKIELDEYGRIVMSPVKLFHAALQGEIEFLLRSLLKGVGRYPNALSKPAKVLRSQMLPGFHCLYGQK